MNFINRFFLKTALLPVGFYNRIGVNTHHLKAILSTKLLMDDRRPPSLTQVRKHKKDKPVTKATLGTILISAITGLLFLFIFSIGENTVTQLTFYFSVFFVMLSLTLISDFTSVLIDVRDNFIILPKPVNDRTVVVARLLHIFIHICKIVLPMSLPATVYMAVQYGVGGPVIFFFLIFLLTAFAIFFINAVYLVILKLTTPQRFQAIISYVQIIFAILVYGGYQVLPRMLSWVDFASFDISTATGIGFFPLYWLAQSWNVLYNIGGTASQVLLASAGLLFPLLCVFVVVKYLAPSFNRKVALITSSTAEPPATITVSLTRQRTYSGFWSRLLTNSKAEKGSFEFTWKMTSRSRDFKLKIYPSIGYLLVYVFIIVLNNKRINLTELGENETQSKVLIVSALYFMSFLLTTAISQMVYSDKFKAAWVFYTSPLLRPGEVIAGATKAVIMKFYVPIVLLITTAGLLLSGPEVLPNIVLGLFNQLLICALQVYIGHKYFPFSVYQSNQVKTGSFLRSLGVFFISGVIAIGHYLLYDFLPVIAVCALLSVAASWAIFDALKKMRPERVSGRFTEE